MCWPCGLGNGVMEKRPNHPLASRRRGAQAGCDRAWPISRRYSAGPSLAIQCLDLLPAAGGKHSLLDRGQWPALISPTVPKSSHISLRVDGIDQTRTLGSRYGGCECRSANEQWQGPLRPSFICQARALRSRIYADLTCSEIRPSWTCGQPWIEVAVA